MKKKKIIIENTVPFVIKGNKKSNSLQLVVCCHVIFTFINVFKDFILIQKSFEED